MIELFEATGTKAAFSAAACILFIGLIALRHGTQARWDRLDLDKVLYMF